MGARKSFRDEYRGGYDRCPKAVFIALGRLGGILRPHNFSAHLKNLFSFIPCALGIKFNPERGSQH
ncbi:MAG: hypothetical protein UV45_C0012G0005 [Candidatus Azambacteria bacterium GW2011_GWB1_42_72]|nr:MAG: hypothetical protein UV45_C0012G0005 [Candidatus Azambacteria bacterium GW2011_GWB1_42_72]